MALTLRGVILIVSTKLVEDLLRTVVFLCGYCGISAQQRVMRSRNRLSVFFVPLFTVSTRYVVECTNCGGTTAISREEADGSVAWAGNTDQR